MPGFEDVKIEKILVEDVGVPDGSEGAGAGRYLVPFLLSRTPPTAWGELFVAAWDDPPEFTTMHRPGIARVSGNRVVLDGTTIEEVEKYHRKTLILACKQANEEYRRQLDKKSRDGDEAARKLAEHQAKVKAVANRISFEEDD